MSGKAKGIFFYVLPTPGIGLLALAKLPCPSVARNSPDLGSMLSLTQAECWWPVNTEAPRCFLQLMEWMRPLGDPPKMTEIYFSSSLNGDLEKSKRDLEGKKKESDVSYTLEFWTNIYTHNTSTCICVPVITIYIHTHIHTNVLEDFGRVLKGVPQLSFNLND